jgi:hypothetical protein
VRHLIGNGTIATAYGVGVVHERVAQDGVGEVTACASN